MLRTDDAILPVNLSSKIGWISCPSYDATLFVKPQILYPCCTHPPMLLPAEALLDKIDHSPLILHLSRRRPDIVR
jgi:hypothetical protein